MSQQYQKYKGFDISYWSFGGVEAARSIWCDPENASGIPFNQQSLNKYKGFAVRPSYLTVRDDGHTERFGGAPGDYTPENHALYKSNYQEVWSTISNSAYHGIEKMVRNDNGLRDECINKCVETAQELDLTGIDINFEAFSEYTDEFVSNFKIFLSQLKERLNAIGKKLCYDPLTIANAQMQGWYKFNYADFIDCVDYLTIMAYDVMDYGVALDTIPVEAIIGGTYDGRGMTANQNGDEPVVQFDGFLNMLLQQIGVEKMNKIIIGLPNYGFVNDPTKGNYNYTNGLTTCQIKYTHNYNIDEARQIGYRNKDVGALRWKKDNKLFCIDDSISIRYKIDKIKEWFDSNAPNGRREIIFWHIGANNIGYNGCDFVDHNSTEQPPIEPEIPEPPIEPEQPKCECENCTCEPCECENCGDECECCNEVPNPPPPTPEPEEITRLHIEDIKITDMKQVNKIINNIKRITCEETISYLLSYQK